MLTILHQYGDLMVTFGLFLLLAVLSWYGGADSLTDSLTDSTGRTVRWSLPR